MANSTLAGVIKLSALALSGSEGATDRLLDAIPAVVAALLGQSGVDEREASARARAAETFLSEAHRRYRAQPTDDGWRRDLDRARAELIRAHAWQVEYGVHPTRRARTEILTACVAASLGDADGVEHWLRQAAATLDLRVDGDPVEVLASELAHLGDSELFGPTAREKTEPRASVLLRQVGTWLEVRGILEIRETREDDPWPDDPRSDPIGWG